MTGGSGYVGRFLIDAIASRLSGVQLHCAHGSDPAFALDFAKQCTSISMFNLTVGADVRRIFTHARPDLVIHLAALSDPGYCEQHASACEAVNIPRHLLMAVRAANASMITFSSEHVYSGALNELRSGKHRGSAGAALYSEDDPTHPVCVYGRTKVALEQEALKMLPGRVIVLRLSSVLGPVSRGRSAKQSYVQLVQRMLSKEKVFRAFNDEQRSFTWVEDVERVVVLLMQRGWTRVQGGIYNLGSAPPAIYTRERLARAIAQQLLGTRNGSRAVIGVKRDPAMFPVASPPNAAMDSTHISLMTGLELSNILQQIRREVSRQARRRLNNGWTPLASPSMHGS